MKLRDSPRYRGNFTSAQCDIEANFKSLRVTYLPISTSGGRSRPRRKHMKHSGDLIEPWLRSAGKPVGVRASSSKPGGTCSSRLGKITAETKEMYNQI